MSTGGDVARKHEPWTYEQHGDYIYVFPKHPGWGYGAVAKLENADCDPAVLQHEAIKNARLIAAAPEMLEALEGALYGMDELLRSFQITHVVRGHDKSQRKPNPDEMSAADEAIFQYQNAREKVEAAISKAKGEL